MYAAIMTSTLVDVTGLKVTCKSEEAVQYYNEAVQLFVGRLANYLPAVEKSLEIDPDFVMAKCFQVSYYCDFLQFTHCKVSTGLKYLHSVYETCTDRERLHIDVLKVFADQNHPKACSLWSDITVLYPQDMYAAKWAFFVFRKMGGNDEMQRDVMARAVNNCPNKSPLYPYILSLYGFTLEENDRRDLAEEVCRKSLSLQPNNPWAIHTMSHIFEEERDVEEGVEFLTNCRDKWESGPFGPHIAWHLMLYCLDLNEVDKILLEYDTMLAPHINTSNVLGLLDTASILWRLNLVGVDPGVGRWETVTKAFIPRMNNPHLSWLQSHLMMSLCHGVITESTARLSLAHEMIKTMEDYSLSNKTFDCGLAKTLGVPLCNALLAFGEERYNDVIQIISPIKYDIVKVGGSVTQRQIFVITLIHAAIRGKRYKEAIANITELKAKKPHSKYLQRLYEQVLAMMTNDNK